MAYAICFPLMSLIICLASPIILIVLGQQWIGCVKTFQLLMFASFPLLIKIVNRNYLKALGYTRDIFLIDLYSFFILLVCIGVSIYLHSYYILVLSFVVSNIASVAFSIYYVSKRCKLSVAKLINDILTFCPIILSAVISVLWGCNGLTINIIISLTFIIYYIFYYIIAVPEYIIITQQIRKVLHKKRF